MMIKQNDNSKKSPYVQYDIMQESVHLVHNILAIFPFVFPPFLPFMRLV